MIISECREFCKLREQTRPSSMLSKRFFPMSSNDSDWRNREKNNTHGIFFFSRWSYRFIDRQRSLDNTRSAQISPRVTQFRLPTVVSLGRGALSLNTPNFLSISNVKLSHRCSIGGWRRCAAEERGRFPTPVAIRKLHAFRNFINFCTTAARLGRCCRTWRNGKPQRNNL